MSNNKSRTEKIRLLKDIAAGKVSIDSAFPQPVQVWYCPDGKTYFGPPDNKGISEKEFNSLPPYRGNRLILKLSEGCDPIID